MVTPIRQMLCLAVFALLSASCARGVATSDARVVVTLQQGLSAADVTRVTAIVRGADLVPPLSSDLVASSGQWVGTLMSIPVGLNRTVDVNAYDSGGTLRYAGSATGVAIAEGQVTLLSMLLQQVTAPPAFSNRAPRIVSVIVSSAQPGAGDVVQLTASAVDGDGSSSLTYQWTSTGGSFSNAGVANPSWTAPPELGAQTLSLTVSDPLGATAGVSFALDVASTSATGGVGLTVGVNTWPVVSLVSANPTRAALGQPFALTTTATDADGDALAYAWTSGCAGTFSDAAVGNPTFTASSAPANGECTLVVSVHDGRGGHTTGSLTVNVLSPLEANFAPEVELTFQSAFSAAGGDTVVLRMQAKDPEGAPVAFSWATSAGSFVTSAPAPTVSQAVLTAPACALNAQVQVTVTATDPGGASSLRAFTVNITGCPMGSAPATPGDSCLQIKQHIPTAVSGLFHLGTPASPYTAACDMTLDGGGWTVFFAGLTGKANAEASFQDPDNCPTPATRCLRHLPIATTTAIWLTALCNDGTADRAVKFHPSNGALSLFRGGTRTGYQPLTGAVALTPGSNAGYAATLHTGGQSDPDWVIAQGTSAQNVFASSYPLTTAYDACNGVPVSGTALRLMYR